MTTEERIRAFYAAFNARAIDTVLQAMTADVEWPNGWEGGRIAGREAVREYWLRQWQAIDGRVEPIEITLGEDDRWTVLVHQVVRAPDGALLADEHVHRLGPRRGARPARSELRPDERQPGGGARSCGVRSSNAGVGAGR